MGTRVTTKGRVTIPLHIRRAAGISAGAELDWHYDPVSRTISSPHAAAMTFLRGKAALNMPAACFAGQ